MLPHSAHCLTCDLPPAKTTAPAVLANTIPMVWIGFSGTVPVSSFSVNIALERMRASVAYVTAGYSPNGSEAGATKLLSVAKVAARIDALATEHFQAANASEPAGNVSIVDLTEVPECLSTTLPRCGRAGALGLSPLISRRRWQGESCQTGRVAGLRFAV